MIWVCLAVTHLRPPSASVWTFVFYWQLYQKMIKGKKGKWIFLLCQNHYCSEKTIHYSSSVVVSRVHHFPFFFHCHDNSQHKEHNTVHLWRTGNESLSWAADIWVNAGSQKNHWHSNWRTLKKYFLNSFGSNFRQKLNQGSSPTRSWPFQFYHNLWSLTFFSLFFFFWPIYL